MADYTYATSSKKAYDEMINQEAARAAARQQSYAAAEQAQNEAYKTQVNNVYDTKIKAQEDTAAADTKKTYASYNADFDANAASQFARERALREQMANYGLSESGFNATNQTALAVARSNADAATRTARGQAVDAIAAELRKYKADAESERAQTLAESDRDSARRVLENEQKLQSAAHGNVMDQLDYDATRQKLDMSQRELDHKIDTSRQEQDFKIKELVDTHNNNIYKNMLDAYDQGNAALAEEYAKQLLQIDENGHVSPMPFDTTGADAYVEEKNREEAATNRQQSSNSAEETHTALGFPQQYDDYIQQVLSSVEVSISTSDARIEEAMTDRAMRLLYLIEQQSQDRKSKGYMDAATFQNLLRYVGVKPEQYETYKESV